MGKQWKQWQTLFWGAPRYCRWWLHEIKRHLLLGRKAMTNLDRILKSRVITLLAKVSLVKATIFPVVMYGCDSWTIKKVECWRIDAFGLWCWRRLLSIPWTARRSNQSILKEISPEYSLEGTDAEAEAPILWSLDAKNWLIGKDPIQGKIEGRREGDDRGWDGWMASPMRWTWVWSSFRSWC